MGSVLTCHLVYDVYSALFCELLPQAWDKVHKVIQDLIKVTKETEKVIEKAEKKAQEERMSEHFLKSLKELKVVAALAEAHEVLHCISK